MYRDARYQPPYYRPYRSDSEDESESDSDESTTSSLYTSSVFSLPDPKQLVRAAGLSFSNDIMRLDYGKDYVNQHLFYSPYTREPVLSNDLYGNTKLEIGRNSFQSLILLNSRDRDFNVYPQPTNLVLRLPRVYRNIVNLQFSQLRLLCSFYYFRADKANIKFFISEKDRILPNRIVTDPEGFPVTINPGSYDINSLIAQLNLQLNLYPLFYDFPGGFEQFSFKFNSTGDLALNFNEVGDYFFDILHGKYISPPTLTKAYVTQTFFANRYANKTTFTIGEIQIAYYYPVIKYALLINYNDPNLSTISANDKQYILYSFRSLNDTYLLNIIIKYIPYLDRFRDRNTFKYSLVNKYVVSYDTTYNIITTTTPNLNSSLVNLLTNQYNSYFNAALTENKLTLADYASKNRLLQENNAALLSMYDYLQQQLAKIFAINYGTYSVDYLANPLYEIFVKDGTNLSNILTAFSLATLQDSQDPITTFSLQVTPPINYWKTLNTGTPLSNTMTFINSNQAINRFYSIIDNDILSQEFVASNTSNINIDVRTRSADIIVPVKAEKYTIIAFKSLVNQSLQVETLSRPLKYRYPAYNIENYSSNIINTFNYQYEYINNSNFEPLFDTGIPLSRRVWNSNIIPIGPVTYGSAYPTEPKVYLCSGLSYLKQLVFSFQSPYVGTSGALQIQKYPVNISFGSNFPNKTYIFMYHDRAALMADLGQPYNENRYHYKQSNIAIADSASNITITLNAYEGEVYYFIVRPETQTFSQFNVYPAVTFSASSSPTIFTKGIDNFDPTIDPTQLIDFGSNFNYAMIYDPDYIRLPISSNLWGGTPTDNLNNVNAKHDGPAIGYDNEGYSTDLTDYRPFSQYTLEASLRFVNYYDPIASNGVTFLNNTTYDSVNQTYFNSNSKNILQTAPLYNTYIPGNVLDREYKIVNWYDSVYIGPTIDTSAIEGITGTLYQIKEPFSQTSTVEPIEGYDYFSNSISMKSELSLFDGVCGFTFIPEDGIWNIRSLTFNSAIMNKSNNNNHAIKYIGIFNTGNIYNIDLFDLSLSNAISVLTLSKRRYYLPAASTNDIAANNPILYDSTYDSNIDLYIVGDTRCQNGSYYTFVASNSSAISGYTENARVFLNKPEYLYSAVAFNSNGSPSLIYQLTGSIVPFPDYSISPPRASNVYFNGVASPNGKHVIVPAPLSNKADQDYRELPYGYDVSQVQYEQSMAMTTTALHMMNSCNPVKDDIGFKRWTYNFDNQPISISANISEYLVSLDSYFTIFKFPLTGPRILTKHASITLDDIFTQGTYLAAYATNDNMLYQVSGTTIINTRKGIIFMGISSNDAGTNKLSFKVYSISQLDSFSFQNPNITGTIYNLPVSVSNLLPNTQFIQEFKQINYGTLTPTPYAIFSTKDSITSNYFLYMTTNIITTPFTPLNLSQLISSSNIPFYFDIDNDNIFIQTSNKINTYDYNNITNTVNHTISGPSNTSNYRNFITAGSSYYILAENNGNHCWGQVYFEPPLARVVLSPQIYASPLISLASGWAYNSKWLLSSDKPYIYGNRGTPDGTLNTAWQIFYPSMKITFNKLANSPVPIVDLTNIEPPEYFHTNIFIYNNLSNLLADTSNTWGNEKQSNYLACDTQFRGFQFNSYISHVPLQTNKTYYLAIRGYTPSEQFETMVRFYMPNRYDYRWVSLSDIATETTIVRSNFTVNNGIAPYDFNPLYAFSLINFDNYFTGNHTYGANIIPSFSGITHNTNTASIYYKIWQSNVMKYSSTVTTTTTSESSTTENGSSSSSTTTTTTVITRITRSGSLKTSGNLTIISGWQGFADFYDQFVYIYNQYMGLNDTITKINNSAIDNINKFIISDLQNILPASALLRQNYNDPLLFSMLFKTGNNPIIGQRLDNWGLGWNLGYPKEDTAYSTIARGNTFFKILDDYVYVRLNDEFNMNKLDISGKENLAESREPTGGVNQYNTKLFLTTFGGYAQTAIMNPISFNPPIAKLDKFSFTLTDTGGAIIDNEDCDWNATLQITEMLETANQTSTFITLKS